ncbi:hypothetical protein BJ978_003139 [Agromyces terreus]|uniref:DUF4307 domain-containing protein n=1 Tax=Agromyces terreus TaxID=424795 RepID=A0A9X2H3V3_9MICO|nr:DUF4307 domain-containing protein [Agromyces terreus]MCP2372463.1 hypothetical protein [Agromyces terreus]
MPAPAAAPTAEPDRLATRYGRTRKRRRRDLVMLVVAGVAFAVVLVAWVVWAGLDGQQANVQATDTGHVVHNDERNVEVTWTLSAPPGETVACTIKALDDEFTVVGWRVVEIPASDLHLRSLTETVRTAQDAATGLISTCWLT